MTKEETLLRYKEWLDEDEPFTIPSDVPDIPRVDPEIYKEFFIPVLIKRGGIPKSKLIDGVEYIGDNRNTSSAIWDKEKNCFVYKRTKFGDTFDDYCNHFEDDDGYALFVPIKIK